MTWNWARPNCTSRCRARQAALGIAAYRAQLLFAVAATWANAYITGPNDAADTLNLYDVSGLAHYELYRAIVLAGNPTGLATSEAALLADLKKQLDKAVTQAARIRLASDFPGAPTTRLLTAVGWW